LPAETDELEDRMSVEVRIPTLGESVTEGVIVRWAKRDGEGVKADEVLLELETDKASVEIPAPGGGVLHILKPEGEKVAVGDVVARIDEDGAERRPAPAAARPAAPTAAQAPPVAPVSPVPPAQPNPGVASEQETTEPVTPARAVGPLSPAVRRLLAEHDLDPVAIPATGKGGRLTKEDVLAFLARDRASAPARPVAVAPAARRPAEAAAEGEERVPMTPIRRRIAERLVQAQRTAAILTTFNEIDMSAVMALRAEHKEAFQKRHGISLGFMSFFARACIAALGEVRVVNAEIRGDDIVYKRFVNLGVAVGTERGLVVPVVRHAERLSFAELEREIARLAGLAREGKLSLGDLSGGTFTISNGGVYGSLLSTPILNPPQSGILGMHKIEKRPVVVGDQIVVRPMMYVALSYDHRLVDGEQAVTFLVRVKERLEDPPRLLLDV
jgi:2-oxoglutarate dehydrogenase E2 component (dihydrolipoamide succinyltransferase)